MPLAFGMGISQAYGKVLSHRPRQQHRAYHFQFSEALLVVPGVFRYVLGGSSEVGGIASRIHSGECIARSIFPLSCISLKMILPSFVVPGGVAVAGRVRKQVEICRW